MKRILVRAAMPAVLLVLGGVASTASLFGGCLPSPDISGLPPYEGGASASGDSGTIVIPDASTGDGSSFVFDGTTGTDTGTIDSGPTVGNITGVVIDYAQGNGLGVLPGATVALSIPGNTTTTLPVPVKTDTDGSFTFSGVPAGKIEITVSKATAPGGSSGTVYSTASVVTNVPAGNAVSVTPVIHEGCYQVVSILGGGEDGGEDAATGSTQTVSWSNACPGFPNAYASLTFDPTAFINPTTASSYTGQVRVEMIPLSYPTNASDQPDLSWTVGLPGSSAPLDLLGAAQYRVYAVDPGKADDGVALTIRTAIPSPVSITVPMFTAALAAPTVSLYDFGAGAWSAQTNVIAGTNQQVLAGAGDQFTLNYVSMPIPSLGWWAVTAPATATGCMTGAIQQGGMGVPNVLVHATGTNVLAAATATTGANGTFCIDLQGTTAAGVAATASFSAGYVSTSGVLYTMTPVTASNFGQGTGTCASSTTCTVLEAFTLTAQSTCVSGNLRGDAGGFAGTLQVEAINVPITSSQQAAGINGSAYLGIVNPVVGTGAFCATAPTGTTIQLQDPSNITCTAPSNGGTITVPTGSAAPICSAGGCVDGGVDITYACPGP